MIRRIIQLVIMGHARRLPASITFSQIKDVFKGVTGLGPKGVDQPLKGHAQMNFSKVGKVIRFPVPNYTQDMTGVPTVGFQETIDDVNPAFTDDLDDCDYENRPWK